MYQKLKELVEYGADIEFVFQGNAYTILPWMDEGIVIGLQDSDNDQVFESYDDMINGYLLDGNTMKDVLDNIEITFTSGC